MQIVLAKVEMTGLRKTNKLRYDGANYFPVFEPAPEAKACMWLNDGDASDVEKAKQFAATEGYRVFTYQNEREPLQRARAEVFR